MPLLASGFAFFQECQHLVAREQAVGPLHEQPAAGRQVRVPQRPLTLERFASRRAWVSLLVASPRLFFRTVLLTAVAVWHRHTFLEGGVRVMSFISGPLVPAARRGTRWTGMAASADWYKTIVEGIAEGVVPANTGTRAPDALNLWPAILDGSAGPRQEVVHQVENQYSCDTTQPGGGCCSSMRMGEMKLIVRRHDNLIAAICFAFFSRCQRYPRPLWAGGRPWRLSNA